MPENLKTYSNRCRVCLEKFYHDEAISTITSFFKSQYFSFTRLELPESDLLSKFVCEFCHSELLRFSGFKRDLIEKQQKLNELLKNELLKQNAEKDSKRNKSNGETQIEFLKFGDGEIFNKLEPVEQDDDEEEEIVSESSEIASDDEKDQDFMIVRANERAKTKKKISSKKIKLEATTTCSSAGVFCCDYCLQTFKAKQGLTRHVQSHIDVSVPWKCYEINCEFAASSKIKLNVHKIKIHGIEPPSPNPPLLEVKIEKRVIKDKVKIEGKLPHTCICGTSFQSVKSLRAHSNRVHGSLKKCTFGCENVQYVKTGHYIRHIQSRHPEKLNEVLKKHGHAAGESSTPGGSVIHLFQCDQCNFKAIKKSSMRSHLESHLPDFARPKFECKTCHKLFTRPTSLRVHQETVHDLIRKFKCSKCPGVSFKQAGHLNDHFASKHGRKPKKSFRCSLCPKMFLKRYLMNRHQKDAHKVVLKREALTQPRAVASKTLKIERKFKCFCGKEFPYQSRLRKHQIKHEEVDDPNKKFPCNAAGCSHSFTARCNLIRHQKQKGHLPANELKRLKFNCSCGERFFSYRGYSYHCDKSKCKKKKKTAKFNADG